MVPGGDVPTASQPTTRRENGTPLLSALSPEFGGRRAGKRAVPEHLKQFLTKPSSYFFGPQSGGGNSGRGRNRTVPMRPKPLPQSRQSAKRHKPNNYVAFADAVADAKTQPLSIRVPLPEQQTEDSTAAAVAMSGARNSWLVHAEALGQLALDMTCLEAAHGQRSGAAHGAYGGPRGYLRYVQEVFYGSALAQALGSVLGLSGGGKPVEVPSSVGLVLPRVITVSSLLGGSLLAVTTESVPCQ